MFSGPSFRPMNGHAPKMGQQSAYPWWPSEAASTVQAWNGLISRAALIADSDARGKLLSWVGRSDVPGSPAERYQAIAEDISGKYQPLTDSDAGLLRQRLDLLNSYKSELEARVKNAEQAYGVLTASAEVVSNPERHRMMICVAGGIALLGFIILPLVLE